MHSSSLSPDRKSPSSSSSSSLSSSSHQPFRALVARSHGRRFHLEEYHVAGSVAWLQDLRRPYRGAPPSPAVAPGSEVLVRIPDAETAPTPPAGEIVVFDEHFYRGFGLVASSFFSEWLHFFGLQPHHLAPNAILQLSAFVVLYEGFLGIEPRLDLW
ncbi:hypothetical protein D1007_59914 [Hordeum vulgare]|nr:hypothetical protein D1007_59914 [Hordeum vulgare]